MAKAADTAMAKDLLVPGDDLLGHLSLGGFEAESQNILERWTEARNETAPTGLQSRIHVA